MSRICSTGCTERETKSQRIPLARLAASRHEVLPVEGVQIAQQQRLCLLARPCPLVVAVHVALVVRHCRDCNHGLYRKACGLEAGSS